VEIAAVIVVAVGIGGFLWKVGGQVGGTDTLLYLDVALQRQASTYILNRYVHVFLLSLFSALAATPLAGMRLYSGIVGGLCVALVYVCGRFLRSTSGPWNGVLALASLLSVVTVLDLFTGPQVDTTAMMMGLIFAAVYAFSARSQHTRRVLIALLGAILVLSFKTKETSLAAVIVLPGLGMEREAPFGWRKLWKNLGYLGMGMLGGLTAIAVANALILGDPLFGLRLSEYLELSKIAQGAFVLLPAPGNWFARYVFPAAGTIFVMYLISGLVAKQRGEDAIRLLWLLPLAQIVFLTLTMIWSTWGVAPRYFGFSLGVLCALAGQLVGPVSLRRPFEKTTLAVLALPAAVLGVFGMLGVFLRPVIAFPTYHDTVLGPIAMAIMLGLLFLEGSGSPRIQPALLLCALVLTVYPARVVVGGAEKDNRPNDRFEPLVVFQSQIESASMVPAFVSLATAERLQVKDRNEVSAIFNIFFDARTRRTDFAMAGADQALLRAMGVRAYRLVLLTGEDWDAIRSGEEADLGWTEAYDVIVEPLGRYILLRLR
jgi:hypothetical protein